MTLIRVSITRGVIDHYFNRHRFDDPYCSGEKNHHHHMAVMGIVAVKDKSFIETSLLMLDEKPVGTHTPRRH
jgi:hypothetical protein